MPHPLGLRARKKAQTRETIVRCAMDLFAERGFDATTIADIAEAADIAPRTFFGYFPSKEAVVFHDFDEMFGSFETRLRERPADQTAFDALRAWIVEMITRDDGDVEAAMRERRRLIGDTPSLDAHERANMGRFHQLLTECVASDLDVPADSLRATMVAAAAVAALESLRELKDDDTSGPEHAIAVMGEVLVFLQGGLDALRATSEAVAASD